MDLLITVIIFVLALVLVIIIKPKFLYDKTNKQFRSFGIGKNKTVLTLPILSIFISTIIFIITYFFNEDTNKMIPVHVPVPVNPYNNYLLNQQIAPLLPYNMDLNSVLEAGIKAKLLENVISNNN